jgi:hypothetical protein
VVARVFKREKRGGLLRRTKEEGEADDRVIDIQFFMLNKWDGG